MINDHIEARLWGDHGSTFCEDIDRLLRYVLRWRTGGGSKAAEDVHLRPSIGNGEQGVNGGQEDVRRA